MTIDVTLPGLIAASLGTRQVSIEAHTVRAALTALAAHRQIGPLIFDDAGELRPHVLVFHNDTSTRHMPSLDVPLRVGDTLAVVQAVSGG